MENHKASIIAASVLLLSASAWAHSENNEIIQNKEPIVIEGTSNSTDESQRQPKIITTRERPAHQHEHHDLSINYPHSMHRSMIIDHHKSGGHQHEGEKMESHASQSHMQHMANMEKRLANIEALLEKLLEMQKP